MGRRERLGEESGGEKRAVEKRERWREESGGEKREVEKRKRWRKESGGEKREVGRRERWREERGGEKREVERGERKEKVKGAYAMLKVTITLVQKMNRIEVGRTTTGDWRVRTFGSSLSSCRTLSVMDVTVSMSSKLCSW